MNDETMEKVFDILHDVWHRVDSVDEGMERLELLWQSQQAQGSQGTQDEIPPRDAVRLVLDVMPDGHFFIVGGDRASGQGDQPYLGTLRCPRLSPFYTAPPAPAAVPEQQAKIESLEMDLAIVQHQLRVLPQLLGDGDAATVPEAPKLDAPAQVGATVFKPGIKCSTVVERAKREYLYNQESKPSDEQLKRARAGFADLLENSKKNWLTLREFESEAIDGWCWIFYKAKVVAAYYNGKRFMFSNTSSDCYLTECVTHVMPWVRPDAPDSEE